MDAVPPVSKWKILIFSKWQDIGDLSVLNSCWLTMNTLFSPSIVGEEGGKGSSKSLQDAPSPSPAPHTLEMTGSWTLDILPALYKKNQD